MTRIRTRLVVAFVIVALLPALPLTVLVRSLLERSFHPPFEAQVTDTLESSLDGLRAQLEQEKIEVANAVRVIHLTGRAPADLSAEVFRVGAADLPSALANFDAGREGAHRVGDWIAAGAEMGGEPVLVARRLPAGLSDQAARTADTIGLLRAFGEERGAVLRGYIGPFLISYALLLAVAVAVGAWIARRLARPVEALAAGSARVGAGDLDTRVTVPASGEVRELVEAFNRMVADLESQRDELGRLERVAAWRDLARSLAHEIKNPLTPIQLAVQQLGDNDPRGEKYPQLLRDCVEIVDEEVEALRRLVREFSEFARLPQPKLEDGDLAALLDELGRLYGERFAWEGARPLPARFDHDELKRVLVNLADNAIAACAEAGRLELVTVTAIPADHVELRVTDRGAGIAPENLARVFEPNFSTKSGGMGLGLAIVEGIVRGHEGTIHVESTRGEGTTFTLTLPAGSPPPAADGPAAGSAATGATTAGPEARTDRTGANR